MNAFVRRLAVIAVLWALCEMLMPEGKPQQMVRMTAGVMVMVCMLSAAGGMMEPFVDVPAWTAETEHTVEENYRRIALQAFANQLASYCERFFANAGYDAQAVVKLHEDGTVQQIRIAMKPAETAQTLDAEAARQHLADSLQISMERVVVAE